MDRRQHQSVYRRAGVSSPVAFLSILAFISLAASSGLAAIASTTTDLNVSPSNTVSAGTVVTLTAAVSSGGTTVPVGVVKFCDMQSATYCQDGAILGSAWVTTGGTATLKLALAYGAHSVQAFFQGTTAYASSSSAVQLVSVMGGALASTTTISSVQYYGYGGLNQAQVTVRGAPMPVLSGSASFLDATNANYLLATVPITAPTLGFTPLTSVGGTPIAKPEYTKTGDFNGDGYMDFAVASNYGSTVQVFLGNGDGTFSLKSSFSSPSPAGLAIADFNRDGNLDLAVLNMSSISIYLGNGDGTFSLGSSPATDNYPFSFVVADVNGDGIADFAVTNNYTNKVQLLIGSGDGSFVPGAVYSTGRSPQDIVAADFNRDGFTDLAMVNELDNTITVLLGNAGGTFTPAPLLGVPATPYTLVAADFNGDGIPDLAVSAIIQGAEIYLGNGDGTFGYKATLTCGSSGNGYGMGTTDFNADGKTDLIVGKALFVGDGFGNFAFFGYGGGSGSPISVADFNGDGSPDLITPVYNAYYPYSGTVNISLEQATFSKFVSSIQVPGPGVHNVVASYGGDGGHAASQSSTAGMTGAQIVNTLALSVSPATTVNSGTTVQFTAAISPSLIGNYSASGSVTFKDGSTVLGTGSVVSGMAAMTINNLSVGSHTISAIYGGDVNFSASSSKSIALTVTQSGPTKPAITWNSPDPIDYGTPLSATQLNASSGGVDGTFLYNPAAGTVLPVGTQILSVTFNPTDTSAYTTATASVSLTVRKATPTVSTWPTASAIGYGQTLVSSSLTGGVASVAGTFAFTNTAMMPSAGTSAQNVTFTPNDTINYNAVSGTVNVTVNKAVLTVTAGSASRTYGAVNPALTASYSGFVNGETSAVITGSPSLTTTATSASPVGTYVITAGVGTLAATNYTFVFVNGTLTVTPATLIITATDQSKVYGQTLVLGPTAFVAVGLQNGENIGSVTLASAGADGMAGVAGSPYPIVSSGASGGTFNPANYTVSYVNGSLVVSKASTTTVVTDPGNVKAGTAFTVSYTVTPQIAGTPTGTLTVTALSSTNVVVATCSSALINGAGSCSMTITTRGFYTLAGDYPGDANFLASSGTAVHHAN